MKSNETQDKICHCLSYKKFGKQKKKLKLKKV
jgi:hypothetical protein